MTNIYNYEKYYSNHEISNNEIKPYCKKNTM